MPASSGSYDFNSITAELVIRKAYELIGMPLSMVTAEQYDSAMKAINFILADWFNQNVNLWTEKLIPIFLTPGQASYPLPSNIQKVSQVFLRSNVRQNFGGIPNNGGYGGVAAYAFDGNPNTACTETQVDGLIGYAYSTPQVIKILGVQSNVDREYTLTFSGQSADYQTIYYVKAIPKALYKKGITQWFLLDDNLSSCPYYQIQETAGATLDISEVYFNNQIQDTTMSEVSRYEYFSYPNKNLIGRPTLYYVDYQITPSLYVWQTPASWYNLIMCSGQSSIETLKSYTESINIPPYFYMALVYGLAEMLAQQYAPEKADNLKIRYQDAMTSAVINNNAEVPLTFEVYSD